MHIINEIQWCNSVTTLMVSNRQLWCQTPRSVWTQLEFVGLPGLLLCESDDGRRFFIHSDLRYLSCCLVKFAVDAWMTSALQRGRCDAISVSSLCIKEEEQQVNCCFRIRCARHRLLFCDMKSSTLRMPLRRSLRDVRARNGSWARPSKGRTASNHQHHEGPLGLACKQRTHKWDGFKGWNEVEIKFGYFSPTI